MKHHINLIEPAEHRRLGAPALTRIRVQDGKLTEMVKSIEARGGTVVGIDLDRENGWVIECVLPVGLGGDMNPSENR